MNHSVYLGLSILDLTKGVIYEFWYDEVKTKYGENAKCCDSFISHLKADEIYKVIAEDVEPRQESSIFELARRKLDCLKEKNEKVIGLMKDALGGQIIKELVRVRAKVYNYLEDNNDEDEKSKGTKTCVIKRQCNNKIWENCLEANAFENKINYQEKKMEFT